MRLARGTVVPVGKPGNGAGNRRVMSDSSQA